MAGQLDPKTGMLTQAPTGTTINNGIVNRPITSSPVSVLPGPDRNSLISSTPQAGYIQGYDTNNNYSPVYVPKGQYVPGISATPNQITTDSLKTGSNVKLPGVTDTNTSDASSLVAGASQNIASLVEQLTPPETDANKKQQSILDQIAGLTGEQGNLGTDQLAAEEQAGIPQLRTQLASINGDIQTKLAEYKVLETENQNKPITMNSIIGNERAILNAKASDIGLLQARANALSGNIEAAQQNVDRAVGLKYQTIEARLNTYQAQLNALLPTLNKEEKVQALAQQTLLDKQKQEIADKKQSEKDEKGYLLDLMTKYPDAKIGLSDSVASAQSKVNGSKIYQDQVRAPLKSSALPSSTTPGNVSSLTQSIIDNPSLFDDLTPTNKGKVISELQANSYSTQNLGLKGLSDTAISSIAQTTKALEDLAGLKTIIQGNEQFVGPITGLQRYNPWSKAKQVQSDVDRVRQTVGKALEGGVLRKEDEEKYKKILATLADTPETAVYKIDALASSIQRDIETFKSLQQSSGRSLDVGGALQKKGAATSKPEDLRKKYNY